MIRRTSLPGRIMSAWRRNSPREFVRLVVYNLRLILTGKFRAKSLAYDREFDRICNVDTRGTDEPDSIIAEESRRVHAVRYEPVVPEHLRKLLSWLALEDWETTEFVDLGSGKGRAIFIAAEWPFRRCTGIELSEQLHMIALGNIKNYRNPRQKCFSLSASNQDATTYTFPTSPLVVFLNNPFHKPILSLVENQLSQSLREAPRDCYVIYYNANHPEVFDSSERYDTLKKGTLGGATYAIWIAKRHHQTMMQG